MSNRWLSGVLAIGLLGVVGCGSGESGDTTTATTEVRPEVRLSPPGARLAPGFVAPTGSQLIGPVFPRATAAIAATTSRVAVLKIDGNPFAVWDDLADQARAAGAHLPGSGVCQWLQSMPPPGPLPVNVSVSEPRPKDADALDCQASADGTSPQGRLIIVQMRLWWWAAGAEIGIEIFDGATAQYTYPEANPGRAPATAADQLPSRSDAPLPSVGEPFGRENNCFETGYERLRVPVGARVVGGGSTPGLEDFAAVLAVTDARIVLEALLAQLDGPDTAGGSFTISHDLVTGGSVWKLSGGVDGGGGGCEMWSSPDGGAVLVTTHSD